MIFSIFSIGLTASLASGLTKASQEPHYTGGPLSVRPVFVIPTDGADANIADDEKLLMRHLEWSQSRYRELLHGFTFEISKKPLVIRLQITKAQLNASREGGAPLVVNAILREEKLTRWNAPYVYVSIFEGPGDQPAGGGRPINGGHANGGGILILSANSLSHSANFQSTLQHELGHGFGLPHVNVYGYSMKTSRSIMSYNPSHHTNGFAPSATPGELIPEDLRGLAENIWAFPGLTFSQERDVSEGYVLQRDVMLGPMDLTTN